MVTVRIGADPRVIDGVVQSHWSKNLVAAAPVPKQQILINLVYFCKNIALGSLNQSPSKRHQLRFELTLKTLSGCCQSL